MAAGDHPDAGGDHPFHLTLRCAVREISVDENGEGKRLDAYLGRYLSGAPKSLLYKQLRKKNITLNGRGAKGDERLTKGDRIQCFFSDDTFNSFMDPRLTKKGIERVQTAPAAPDIVYEDDAVILVNKPAGLLTQSAEKNGDCLNSRVVSLLIRRGEITTADTVIFSPSACHRLDRNTSGLVICAKTRAGADAVSVLLRERELEKYYVAPVHGEIEEETLVDIPLSKDEDRNMVRADENGLPAVTEVRPLNYIKDIDVTLVKLKPVTGRPHQLRAHMALISHPIVGDRKYGGKKTASDRAKHQLLCCYELVFPVMSGALEGLSGRKVTIHPPFESEYMI